MGNFSRDTFDKLKHYVGVRLQQGVPIVDADWNELEDIRKYELQSFLKWFVGNGVPYGNDGFRITAASGANNFGIQGGNGTPDGAGRCLVDGLDALNESSVEYVDQTLYNNNNLAADWGVDPLPPLSTPESDRTDTVYLDVWEREVDSTEDSNLINAAIGIETAVRRKREWVVRVQPDSPTPPTPAPGHAHYALAQLNRTASNATITAAEIVDQRTRGLRLPSYSDIQQMAQDAFGSNYTLDNDGQPNLLVSLREAINAIMRGNLPATPAQQLTSGATHDLYSNALHASNGDIWLFWWSFRDNAEGIWYKRYIRATNTWSADDRLVSNEVSVNHRFSTIEDSNGDIWVFWQSANNIWYNRYNATTGWQEDTSLVDNVISEPIPKAVADSNGGIWVFWQDNENGNTDIWSDFYTPGGGWQGRQQRTTSADRDRNPYAIAASNGDIWLFWQRETGSNHDIWSARYSAGSWQPESRLTFDAALDINPVAIEDSDGAIWVFWRSYRSGTSDLWYKRYSQTFNTWLPDTALTADAFFEINFSVLRDRTNRIWVFWASPIGSGVANIFFKIYTPENGWGLTLRLTTDVSDGLPTAIEDERGKIHVFWSRNPRNVDANHLWTRVLTPQI